MLEFVPMPRKCPFTSDIKISLQQVLYYHMKMLIKITCIFEAGVIKF